MRWNPGTQYDLKEVGSCHSLTVTAAGELVMWVSCKSEGGPYKGPYEARWYDQQGNLIMTLPSPPQCGHYYVHVLAVKTGGKQQVVFACNQCQCIWLVSPDVQEWNTAWQAPGEEASKMLYRICHGKPGQIIAVHHGLRGSSDSVSVFDITRFPFRVKIPEVKLGMRAENLCYCELPKVRGAVAVIDGDLAGSWGKLCMFRLDSGALLWSVGGKDFSGNWMKIAGAMWAHRGICSDSRGRLFVTDITHCNNRIIVFSAASGSVLQVVQGRGHYGDTRWVVDPGITVYGPDIGYTDGNPEKGVASGSVLQEIKDHSLKGLRDLCWHEESKSIIGSSGKNITYIQLEF